MGEFGDLRWKLIGTKPPSLRTCLPAEFPSMVTAKVSANMVEKIMLSLCIIVKKGGVKGVKGVVSGEELMLEKVQDKALHNPGGTGRRCGRRGRWSRGGRSGSGRGICVDARRLGSHQH